MERTGGKKERNDEKEEEEEEGSKDGTQSERKHRGMHFARVYVRVCMYADVYRCIPTCVGIYVGKSCVWNGFSARGRTKSTMRTMGEYRGGGRGEERQGETQRRREGERDGERERDVAKQRPSPISILIELNATSYLMPETRQKLQLNGDAISLYLPAHSS